MESWSFEDAWLLHAVGIARKCRSMRGVIVNLDTSAHSTMTEPELAQAVRHLTAGGLVEVSAEGYEQFNEGVRFFVRRGAVRAAITIS
jgi:hypothetical protein